MKFHRPVLVPAVENYWIHRRPGVYVDATLGGGGYEKYLLTRAGSGLRFIGIDLDQEALAYAKNNLRRFGRQVTFCHGDFRDLARLLDVVGIDVVDGILFDLGVSSSQLDTPSRGFSYRTTGFLDMRMDASRGVSAGEIVAEYDEAELADLFWRYGEERFARRIARAIVRARQKAKIDTTTDLAEIIRSVIPAPKSAKTLSRCFQAIRFKVNDELSSLAKAMTQVPTLLREGGRVVVVCYESLSDRITKDFFVQEQKGCRCPPKLPHCVCGYKPTLKILTKRPVVPQSDEILRNSRARGAKLRAAERVIDPQEA